MPEDKPDEAIQATKADVRMLSDQMDALGDLVWVGVDIILASLFAVGAVVLLPTKLAPLGIAFALYAGVFTLQVYAKEDIWITRRVWNGSIGRLWDAAREDKENPSDRMDAANDYFTGENE